MSKEPDDLKSTEKRGWRLSPLLAEGWHLLRVSGKEWWYDDTFRYAAALAFYTTFSVAPVLLIAVGAASVVVSQDTAIEKIVGEVDSMVGEQGAEAVRGVLSASLGLGSSPWAIALGIGTLVIGASAVFGELQTSLNRLWDVERDPGHGLVSTLVAARARSFALALCVGFLLLVSLVMSAAITALQTHLDAAIPSVPWVWRAANVAVSAFVAAILFAMIYRFLPDVRLKWREVAVGAAVTAVLFTIGKFAIGVYLGRAAVANAFGAAGSFVVLLFWVYYSSLVCFFGAEFTQVFARRHGAGIRPLPHARRLGRKRDGA